MKTQYYAIRLFVKGKWHYYAQYSTQILAYPTKERANDVIKDHKEWRKYKPQIVAFPAHITWHNL